jgi:hypothetical protein
MKIRGLATVSTASGPPTRLFNACVELKSVERLEPVHELQLLTYLRLSGCWLGLLVNFNSALIKHGYAECSTADP